jgi:hypothetical protein
MQINMKKNLVEFTPQSSDEKSKLEALWRLMVDCMRFNKKLVPVGEYVPEKNKFARFAIEGEGELEEYPEVIVEEECTCYCQTCNKFVKLIKGDRIPPCCGKLMEVLD